MKITSIKIEKLFEIFDYDISFSEDPNLLIITGPNGFGKTTILNVLFSFFNQQFSFFQQLSFKTIAIGLNDEIIINFSKNIDYNYNIELHFDFTRKNELIIGFNNDLRLGNIEHKIQTKFPIHQIEDNLWSDESTGKSYTFENLLKLYYDNFGTDDDKRLSLTNESLEKVNSITNLANVHYIKEQRLFKKVITNGLQKNGEENEQAVETIQTYAEELRKSFGEISFESYKISQQLDSSYPNRLINEKGILSEDEYNIRLNNLKEKQDKLIRIGIYQSQQEVLAYSKADAKALLVYLNDLERKMSVFDTLLEKLELFTTILNERRFTFKSIYVDRDKGFYFKTSNGKELELSQLSSGEQHEVILLYELIFNAKENTLVLIDEPEISLHVTWQKEFLKDLLKIIELQNIQVIVATHAPAIINGRWDLVYSLEKNDA